MAPSLRTQLDLKARKTLANYDLTDVKNSRTCFRRVPFHFSLLKLIFTTGIHGYEKESHDQYS